MDSKKVSPPISAKGTQAVGFIVSSLTGLAVFVAVWWFIAWGLDFWYIDEVLAPPVGFVLGGLSGYEMFTSRQREVALNWVGVLRFLKKPTGTLLENGVHWIAPFFDAISVPEAEKFIAKMPGEKFTAQDGTLIYFGISDEPEKRNRIQYSIVDPIAYLAADNPEDGLRGSYLQEARVFFGQAKKAIGVRNEQTLWSDFIVLPPGDSAAEKAVRDAFAERLTKVEFTSEIGGKEAVPERLFSNESVALIMRRDNAGDFLRKAATWGIGNITAFTPNVRANPEAERAEAERQATAANMATADIKAKQVKKTLGELKKQKVSPDLAASLAANLAGEEINITNTTTTVSGLPEVIRELGTLAIEKLAKKS